MAFHAKRSPSRAHQFINCPGSLALSESVPAHLRAGNTDEGRLGTAVHTLIEHCLKHGKDPTELRNRIILIRESGDSDKDGGSILRDGAKLPKPGPDEYVFIIDDSMVESALVCTDYVRLRCRQLSVKEKALELETRTNPLPDRDDTSGTADITIPAIPEVLELVDFKNGRYKVEVKSNPQILAYLVGKAIDSGWAYNEYRATVVQPNAEHADGRIRSVTYTEVELRTWQKEYEFQLALCDEADAEFETADPSAWRDKWVFAGDHCVFCEAGAACPKRRQAAEDAARIEFADEPKKLPVPAAHWSPVGSSVEAQVAHVLKWKPFLESLFDAAEFYAVNSAMAGGHIPGFKLVRKKRNRELIAGVEDQIAAAIAKEFGIATDKLFKREIRSGPQIEKLLPAKQRKKFASMFMTKPEGDFTIAPDDDPRPAAPVKLIDEFTADETDGFDFG